MSDDYNLISLLKKSILKTIGLVDENPVIVNLPVRSYFVSWYEATSSNSSSGKSEYRSEPAFYELASANQDFYQDIFDHPDVKQFMSAVATFIEEKGLDVGSSFRDQASAGRQLIGQYFNRVGSFSVNDAVIVEVVDRFIEDLTSESAIVSTVYLVGKFHAAREFNLTDEIRFRKITESDIDRFGRINDYGINDLQLTDLFLMNQHRVTLNTKDWICEVRWTGLSEQQWS